MTGGQREITEPVTLCVGRGKLNPAAVGWSRQPLHACRIDGRWPRRKRWNYWCIYDHQKLFSVTIASLDYTGLLGVYFLDFEPEHFLEETILAPFAGGIEMADDADGPVTFERGGVVASFRPDGDMTRMELKGLRLGGKDVETALRVRRPAGHESLNVVAPWSRNRFQFTSKQHALPASGAVRMGTKTWFFDESTSFACLDFGRGVWPYRCAWNWAGGTAKANGATLGLNFGAKWTDGTGANENGVCVDGVLHKIHEDVTMKYDRSNFKEPWRISTGSGSIDLQFVPTFERVASANQLIVRSEVHQLFGRYHGRCTLDGRDYAIDSSFGWAEEHLARW